MPCTSVWNALPTQCGGRLGHAEQQVSEVHGRCGRARGPPVQATRGSEASFFLWKGSSIQLFSAWQLAAGARSDGGPAVVCWACGLPSPLPSAHALCLRCLCLRTPLEPLPPICWQVQLTVRLVRAPAVWDVLWCMPHLTARRSPTRTNSSAAPPYWRTAEAVASPSMAL